MYNLIIRNLHGLPDDYIFNINGGHAIFSSDEIVKELSLHIEGFARLNDNTGARNAVILPRRIKCST